MVSRHYFAHVRRGDGGPAERARRAGYLNGADRWLVGETLAWGWGHGGSANRIVQSWMRSPGHRRVLLRPDYRELGVGVVWGGPHPRSLPDATVTADFGVRNWEGTMSDGDVRSIPIVWGAWEDGIPRVLMGSAAAAAHTDRSVLIAHRSWGAPLA
jgi:Cysteine-rich secretory protein family